MNEDQARQFGELVGKVNAIKENTDRIPALMTQSALHSDALKQLAPKVERHEAAYQRVKVLSLPGVAAAIMAFIYRGHS